MMEQSHFTELELRYLVGIAQGVNFPPEMLETEIMASASFQEAKGCNRTELLRKVRSLSTSERQDLCDKLNQFFCLEGGDRQRLLKLNLL